MKELILINIEDVLALISGDDTVGPKPSRLREEINNLQKYGCMLIEPEDCPEGDEFHEEYCIINV